MSSFTTPLRIEDAGRSMAGRQIYRVMEPFVYEVGKKGSGWRIEVPEGFHTDFASVPRCFWPIFPPIGQHGKAAVVHDYLYRSKSGFSRVVGDAIFLDAMTVLGVTWWRRWAMYLAVRLFGRKAN